MTTYSTLPTKPNPQSELELDTRYAIAKLIPAVRQDGCYIISSLGAIELTKAESTILADAVEKLLNERLATGTAK